ncbi:MAG: hypothetical protein ACR2PX_22970 [Endozoicomonas sp.]|uniref:hypothetical protein n=1 Tax=Endozoicomonas sp. TaxID=1892382 RepID=UPI003D9B1C2F
MHRETVKINGVEGLIYRSVNPSPYRVLYLHGSGAFGQGIAGLFEYPDLPSLIENGLELDHDVLIPVSPTASKWQTSYLDKFLVTSERILSSSAAGYHLMGYSRGANGVYEFVSTHLGQVVSAIIVSGRKLNVSMDQSSLTPFLLIHGASDNRVSVSEARISYDLLSASGRDVHLEVVDGDHYIAEEVFSKAELYVWQQKQEHLQAVMI